jgi:hypothetical protein
MNSPFSAQSTGTPEEISTESGPSLGLCSNWTQQRRAKKISLDDRAGKCQTPEALAIALSSKQAGCVATINIINFNFFDFLKASKRV